LLLWKHLNMETPQDRNWPKSEFGPISFFFKNLRKSLKNLKVLRDFQIFWISFRYIYIWLVFGFLCPFPLFLKSVYGFQKSFKSSDWLTLFLGTFPLFLGPFLVFKKSFKITVCWLVSSFFGSVSSFFSSVSGFQKKF